MMMEKLLQWLSVGSVSRNAVCTIPLWKSETNWLTDQLTGVVAEDAYASKSQELPSFYDDGEAATIVSWECFPECCNGGTDCINISSRAAHRLPQCLKKCTAKEKLEMEKL